MGVRLKGLRDEDGSSVEVNTKDLGSGSGSGGSGGISLIRATFAYDSPGIGDVGYPLGIFMEPGDLITISYFRPTIAFNTDVSDGQMMAKIVARGDAPDAGAAIEAQLGNEYNPRTDSGATAVAAVMNMPMLFTLANELIVFMNTVQYGSLLPPSGTTQGECEYVGLVVRAE